MSRISGDINCPCCGEPESNSGCVLGPRCRCDSIRKCDICLHCLDHHVKECTGDVWAEHMRLMAELRARHHINIFDIGQKQEMSGVTKTKPFTRQF